MAIRQFMLAFLTIIIKSAQRFLIYCRLLRGDAAGRGGRSRFDGWERLSEWEFMNSSRGKLWRGDERSKQLHNELYENDVESCDNNVGMVLGECYI